MTAAFTIALFVTFLSVVSTGECGMKIEGNSITADEIFGAMGSDMILSTPAEVPRLNSITDICTGGYSTLALHQNGTVYAWGFINRMRKPTKVQGLEEPITALACGDYHVLALGASGTVYAWGTDREGSLGSDKIIDGDDVNVPVIVKGELEGQRVVSIAAGLGHSLALTEDGKVYLWGLNTDGQLGTTGKVTSPKLLTKEGTTPLFADSVKCGGRRTVVVEKGTGKVYVFGVGDFGVLGTGDELPRHLPADITSHFPEKCKPEKISCGGDHTLALCEGGEAVVGFGWNEEGQLGTGDLKNVLLPVIVYNASATEGKKKVRDVLGSKYSNSFLLMEDGTVMGTGNAQTGVLGAFSAKHHTSFAEMNLLQPDVVVKMAAGYKHAAFLTNEGKILVVGDNTFGQLGIENQ